MTQVQEYLVSPGRKADADHARLIARPHDGAQLGVPRGDGHVQPSRVGIAAQSDGQLGHPARRYRRWIDLPPDGLAGCHQTIDLILRQLRELNAGGELIRVFSFLSPLAWLTGDALG